MHPMVGTVSLDGALRSELQPIVERAGKTLWEGDEFRRAIAEGRTLEDLRVQAGDQLIVPSNKHSDLFSPIRFIAVLLSIPVTISTLTHLKKPGARRPKPGPVSRSGGLGGGELQVEPELRAHG